MPRGFRLRNADRHRLNESPSEKEGKYWSHLLHPISQVCLNESPSEKEGKWLLPCGFHLLDSASMKVPPKRKGNGFGVSHPSTLHMPQ